MLSLVIKDQSVLQYHLVISTSVETKSLEGSSKLHNLILLSSQLSRPCSSNRVAITWDPEGCLVVALEISALS